MFLTCLLWWWEGLKLLTCAAVSVFAETLEDVHVCEGLTDGQDALHSCASQLLLTDGGFCRFSEHMSFSYIFCLVISSDSINEKVSMISVHH